MIGVNDEGQIIGLENDFRSLNGNKDEFELHLRNLLIKNFGQTFTINNLEICFPMVDGIEICKIFVKAGRKQIYLEIMDRNGVRKQKFYVRNGNSSQDLSPSEAGEYILTRFSPIT